MVSGRHVGAQLDGHQHGVSIQISINLGKKFLRISSIRKFAVTWILTRVFAQLPSFFSPIMDFICWTVLIISLIYSEWRDSENQQLNFIGVFWFHFLAKCCKFHRVSSQAIWSFCWHFSSIHVLIVNSFSCFSNFEQACDWNSVAYCQNRFRELSFSRVFN